MFRVPPGCDPSACEHLLMWNDTGNGTVMFFISAKIDNSLQQNQNVWTAMGLSETKNMVSQNASISTAEIYSRNQKDTMFNMFLVNYLLVFMISEGESKLISRMISTKCKNLLFTVFQPDTFVVDCIYLSQGDSFIIQASYNEPHAHKNTVLTEVHNMVYID